MFGEWKPWVFLGDDKASLLCLGLRRWLRIGRCLASSLNFGWKKGEFFHIQRFLFVQSSFKMF